MTRLEQELNVLRRLFEPWNTAPHGTVIWEPEASDPNAHFKRDLIGKANGIITAGENAIAGATFTPPQFEESQFDAINEVLANDHERDSFYELAVACDRVAKMIAHVAT